MDKDYQISWSVEDDCYLCTGKGDYSDVVGVGEYPSTALKVYRELLEDYIEYKHKTNIHNCHVGKKYSKYPEYFLPAMYDPSSYINISSEEYSI